MLHLSGSSVQTVYVITYYITCHHVSLKKKKKEKALLHLSIEMAFSDYATLDKRAEIPVLDEIGSIFQLTYCYLLEKNNNILI